MYERLLNWAKWHTHSGSWVWRRIVVLAMLGGPLVFAAPSLADDETTTQEATTQEAVKKAVERAAQEAAE
jgi:hypothetical protein